MAICGTFDYIDPVLPTEERRPEKAKSRLLGMD